MNINIYSSLNMKDPIIINGTVTAFGPHQLWVESGSYEAHYVGSFGTYLYLWYFGTITGGEVYKNSSLLYSFDNANLDLEYISNLLANAPGVAIAQILSGHDVINGSNENDKLYGYAGNDAIDGNRGSDLIIAGSGQDTLIGGPDGDTLKGGADDDTLIGGSGSDELRGGNGNDTLKGGSGSDVLIGATGNDILNGQSGPDEMRGGDGDDTYYVNHASDMVTENPGEGTDLVYSNKTFKLRTNQENLTLTGGGDISGTGNSQNNTIIGNGGMNILDGRGGVDIAMGGAGNDTYIVNNTNDQAIENIGEGIDKVESSKDYELGDNLEKLILTGSKDINGTGNDLDNVVRGNAGNNILDGEAGADTMRGRNGDDSYFVDHIGDVVVEKPEEGTDTINSAITYELGEDQEHLSLIGGDSIDGTGNELDNLITGNSGDNVLSGGLGDDTLQGGLGDDFLTGGDSGDIFVWTKSDVPGAGVAADVVDDLDIPDGDTLDLSDLLSDGSHTIEGLAAIDGSDTHLQLSIENSSNVVVQTIDINSIAVISDADAANTLTDLLDNGVINDGL